MPAALQLLALLRSSAPYVRSEADWRTVCAIIKLTSGVQQCCIECGREALVVPGRTAMSRNAMRTLT